VEWIKLHTRKWFLGSTRWELTLEERAIWVDLLARAGLNEPVGQIDFFSYQQLADQFIVPLELLKNSLEKFVKLDKIELFDNCIKIKNWLKYQTDTTRHRKFNIENSQILRKNNIENSQKKRKPNIEISHQIREDKNREDKNREEIIDYQFAETQIDESLSLPNSYLSNRKKQEKIPYKEIIAYLNEKTGSNFKPETQLYRRHIKARWNEGMRLEDFKRVVDNKCKQWLNDPKMVIYLKPQTLFGPKMDSYLNEPIILDEIEKRFELSKKLFPQKEEP